MVPELDTSLAICVADPLHRQALQNLAAQLQLNVLILDEADLRDDANLATVELLLADEAIALAFAQRPGDTARRRGALALVAVTPTATPAELLLPVHYKDALFDGLLTLPHTPALVLAYLSVILYAHRAYLRRFESAIEELQLNRRIFSSVTSGICVADAIAPDYPVTYVNPAFEAMTGYKQEEILGRNCRFLQGNLPDQPGLTTIRTALSGERETISIVRNFRKDGTAFWNELSLSPIRDRHGRVTHFVGIQHDVTARIDFEEALRQSEKLAAVGRLAASIAHEINNPLEAVTNLLYLARLEADPAQKDQYLHTAEEELHRVAELTTQSLRFYKQSTLPQAVQAADLVTAVLDVYRMKLLNYDITLTRRDTHCEAILCMESEVRQVLSNLVRNAMEAVMAATSRTMFVRSRAATDWQSGARGISITVADTGSGMSAATKEKLYTPFYTTKGVGGTGLGLWVSSEIIGRHHGSLTVRSRQRDNGGTVFRLFLPYAAPVTPQHA